MPLAAPVQNDGAVDAHVGERAVPQPKGTPSLSHRMKHDKSILALVVSSQYIFAGTQGGELLVCVGKELPRSLPD